MATIGQTVKPAFKYEVSPQAMKRVESMGMPDNRQLFKLVFAASIGVHILAFFIKPDFFWGGSKMNLEESWDVDVEFLGDVSMNAPVDTALPNSEKSPEEAVPLNLLPQLPKKFQIEEQKTVEDTSPTETIDKKTEEALAEEKLAKPDEKTLVKKMEEDANKIALDDLRKRLAVEKLKQENKTDEKMKAQKDALAKLKQDAKADDADANSGSSGKMVGVMRNNAYGSALKSAVARNFNLPENFRYNQSKMAVPLIVVINDRGELISIKLNGSSGSDVYDKAVMTAIKNSVPLPTPPREFAGREIQFNFGM